MVRKGSRVQIPRVAPEFFAKQLLLKGVFCYNMLMSKKSKKPAPQLELDPKNAKVGGVASGIAKYYHKDPIWVRIVAVVVIILTGIIPGLIIYGAFYSLMKKTKDEKT